MIELNRLFLDTNIYIIGTQDINSDEAKILTAIGYYGKQGRQLESQIIFSAELIDQKGSNRLIYDINKLSLKFHVQIH